MNLLTKFRRSKDKKFNRIFDDIEQDNHRNELDYKKNFSFLEFYASIHSDLLVILIFVSAILYWQQSRIFSAVLIFLASVYQIGGLVYSFRALGGGLDSIAEMNDDKNSDNKNSSNH